MFDGISCIEKVLGTMLTLSNLITFCKVEICFLRRLESDEGSCANAASDNTKTIKTRYIPGVFNQFLLVMLKISIYCAGKANACAY